MKNSKLAAMVKPIQKWTARELQARLLPVVQQADPDGLRKLVPFLTKLGQDLEAEKVARTKDLGTFSLTGDLDSQVLAPAARAPASPPEQRRREGKHARQHDHHLQVHAPAQEPQRRRQRPLAAAPPPAAQ